MADTQQIQRHTHISSKHRLLDLKLKEVWRYRDLVWQFARRALVATYKQTILGPLWLILNPLFTSIIYLIIFGQIAGLSTEGVPQIIFYLLSNATWSFFSYTITACSDTFVGNAHIFGKVYFPRLTIPLSHIIIALVQFVIQLALGLVIAIYYMVNSGFMFTFTHWPLIIVVLLLESVLALGFGVIASSLTTRYRDLRIVINFGVRLWMYVTPVVYPLSQFADGGLIAKAMLFNPMTAPMELMRWCLWGTSTIPASNILYSAVFGVVVLFLGIMLFNKVERTFMDTV